MLTRVNEVMERWNMCYTKHESKYLKNLLIRSGLRERFKQDFFELMHRFRELTPRLWENEERVLQMIEGFLGKGKVYRQDFRVMYPLYEYEFLINGKDVFALPAGIKSGEVDKVFINGLDVEEAVLPSFFTYNPFCRTASTPSFYNATSLAISSSVMGHLQITDDYYAKLKVKFKRFKSGNLLVGNMSDPRTIVFTHFDSLWGGVIDNAVGVAILLVLLKYGVVDKKKVLVVFAGSEELNIEGREVDWAKGYKMFLEDYSDLALNAEKIYIVDVIGRSKESFRIHANESILNKAFPFEELKEGNEIFKKAKGIFNDFESIKSIYHSPLDNFYAIKDVEFYFSVLAELLR